MRKTVGTTDVPRSTVRAVDELDIESAAHVFVTSEHPGYPVEQAFDGRRGPGGTEWVAGASGPQTITLAFDAPKQLRAVMFEVEENGATRTQEVELALSLDGGRTFETVRRQEFNFSPSGATFEHERWAIDASGVTHLRLTIHADKNIEHGNETVRARLTSLAVEVAP